jgi:hypothetical protein
LENEFGPSCTTLYSQPGVRTPLFNILAPAKP